MSGIMAIVSLDGRPVPCDLARAQLNAIAHRGEWEPRLWEGPGIALGHVNLPRTPEAEREMLPASDSSERYWITWDGRLDNRGELASLLHLDSERARQMTDADYVLAAYTKLQAECVHHLLGDWAVVIWDSLERRLFCAKDPLGWRQLYFAEFEGMLAIGSEPQQFFCADMPPSVNVDYVLRHLAEAMPNRGETCYEGVNELQGGMVLRFDGQVRLSDYWQFPNRPTQTYRNVNEYLEAFTTLVDDATRVRMRSNRPVATLLSGGLDSSYVTAVAAKYNSSLTSYSACVPDSRYFDEMEYARYVSTQTSSRLIEVDTSDAWYLSSRWLGDETFDQPHLPHFAAPLVSVATLAQEHGVGVLLGGEGGDEWIDGGAWNGSRYRCLADALRHARLRTAWRIAGQRPGRSRLRSIAGAIADDCVPGPLGSLARSRVKQPYTVLSPYVETCDHWQSRNARDDSNVWRDNMSRRVELEVYRIVVTLEVGWRDRHVFSRHGLENRSPFNDLRVVSLLFHTPQWVKQHDGSSRALLRAALRQIGLPKIADRSTKGFPNELLVVGLAEKEQQRLIDGIVSICGLAGARAPAIESLVNSWRQRPRMLVAEPYWLAATGIWLNQVRDRRIALYATARS